ncbi:hypothetical protein D3C72_2263690 [compost metagenome]
MRARIGARRPHAGNALSIGKSAGIVLRPVDAIGIRRQRVDPVETVDVERQRQQEFAVAATLAIVLA